MNFSIPELVKENNMIYDTHSRVKSTSRSGTVKGHRANKPGMTGRILLKRLKYSTEQVGEC